MPSTRSVDWVCLRWNQVLLGGNWIEHSDVHTSLVFEFEPELTVPITGLLGFQVGQLVLASELFSHSFRVFFNAKDKIVLDDD